jgi:NADH-quinone oxidoreductase subunit M
MSPFPLLSVLSSIPFLGALLTFLARRQNGTSDSNALHMGLWSSGLTLILSLGVLYLFDPFALTYQLSESYAWVPSLGLSLELGIDGVSLSMILLTSFLVPLCILSCKDLKERRGACIAAFLCLEGFLIAMFCAQDLLFFYIFFEATLIPMFFIIGLWGGKNRIYATFKLFLYTLFGSLIMLVALLYVYQEVGTLALEAVLEHTFNRTQQTWLFLGFFFAMAIKIPMVPVHTWLPDAHVEAPTAGSMILAGVLLKMGAYGMYRFLLPLFPIAAHDMAPYIYALSIAAIIYAALIALIQKDMKRLVAYSSISHMGMVTFGLFVANEGAIQGALFQMISHGLTSAGLFFFVGCLYHRFSTRSIADYQGLMSYAPFLSVGMVVLTFASIGLPGTSGFIGEFLIFIYGFKATPVFASLAALGLVLGASYALWLAKRILFGTPYVNHERFSKDHMLILAPHEKWILLLLCTGAIAFGVYPSPILNLHKTSVKQMVNRFNHDVHLQNAQMPHAPLPHTTLLRVKKEVRS